MMPTQAWTLPFTSGCSRALRTPLMPKMKAAIPSGMPRKGIDGENSEVIGRKGRAVLAGHQAPQRVVRGYDNRGARGVKNHSGTVCT